MSKERLLGESMKRKEDPRLLAGKGRYVDDIRLPNMVYMAVLRSPYAHAKIKSIDVSKALSNSKVLGVVTGKEIAKKLDPVEIIEVDGKDVSFYPLAVDKVKFVGEGVVAIVAEDPYVAKDALDLVDVDYEPLPAVTDPEKALKHDSPLVHEEVGSNVAYRVKKSGGDVERAFGEAEVIVKERLVNQRVAPVPIETRGVVASYDKASGEFTVWLNTQFPHQAREWLAETLRVPAEKVRIISPDVGGAFGSKLRPYPEESLACYFAKELSRPVKWIEERRENMMVTSHGRDHIDYVELAAKKDGTILGMKVKKIVDVGAFGSFIVALSYAPGAYRIRNVEVEAVGVFTNKCLLGAYRGAGRPEATYLIERAVSILARKIGIDPAEVRLKNFIRPEEFPYKNALGLVYDSGNYEGALRKAMESIGYWELRKEQEKLRKEGKYVGIGVSSYVEVCGFGFDEASLRVEPSGKVTVTTGTKPHGQGEDVVFAKLVADELGVSTESVEVIHGDTKLVPKGMGTAGSRTLVVGAGAIREACKKAKQKAIEIASRLLEARVDDLEYVDGNIRVKGIEGKSLSIWDVAKAYDDEGINVSARYDLEMSTAPFGTHIAYVDVDVETGKVTVLRYVAVDDCGKVMNPMLVEGQIVGGVAQAIGQALYEEVIYDDDGNLLTSTLFDYVLPSAKEIPNIESYRTVTLSPVGMGAKGVGEAGTIGATPAVVDAIEDALSPLGIRIREMPVTPEYLWRLIREK